MMRRILLVDDDELLTTVWSKALRHASLQVDVAGQVDEAKEKLLANYYDVVLVDLNLEDGSGAEIVKLARRLPSRPGVAVISGFIDSAYVADLCPFADLFVPKPVALGVLLRVVRFLLNKSQDDEPVAYFCRQHGLSRREKQVLIAAGNGLQNKEIAVQLSCQLSTVTTYWNRIFDKVGLRSRHEILAALFHSRPPTRELG